VRQAAQARIVDAPVLLSRGCLGHRRQGGPNSCQLTGPMNPGSTQTSATQHHPARRHVDGCLGGLFRPV